MYNLLYLGNKLLLLVADNFFHFCIFNMEQRYTKTSGEPNVLLKKHKCHALFVPVYHPHGVVHALSALPYLCSIN